MPNPDDPAPPDTPHAPKGSTRGDDAETASSPAMTIDEIAAATQVPSRTIRFYQSKGALMRPEIRGRVAYYGPEHIERLALIGQLKERGLRIRAIRDLVDQIDGGEVDLGEWLGLEERLKMPWLDDGEAGEAIMSRVELEALFAGLPPEALPLATTWGLVNRRGENFVLRSRGMVQVLHDLHAADIDMDLAAAAGKIIEEHVKRMNRELVELFVTRAGKGFGRSNAPGDLVKTFEGVRGPALHALTLIFAGPMQTVLARLVEYGRAIEEVATTGKRDRRRDKKR